MEELKELREVHHAIPQKKRASRVPRFRPHPLWEDRHDSLRALRELEEKPLRTVFDRNEDEDGGVFYTIKKRLSRIRRPENPKFFEMPDIVIDLDAEDCKGVREFNEKEEEQMAWRWSDKKRPVVTRKVDQLAGRVSWMRQRWERNLAHPTSPWRINHHDIMSLALRGVAYHSSQSFSRGLTTGDVAEHEDMSFLDFLCKRNSIPPQALSDDKSMLEWMLIRKSTLEQHVATQPEAAATPRALISVLQNCGTLLSLRRAVAACSFGSLGNERENLDVFGSDDTVAVAIRESVSKLITGCGPNSHQVRDAMAILGNIETNLRGQQRQDGAQLWTLSLQLAANHSLLAVTEYVGRGLEAGYALNGQDNAQTILLAMQIILPKGQDETASDLWNLSTSYNANHLFQLLTGYVPDSDRTTASIRSLVFSLAERSSSVEADLGSTLYFTYIDLLAQVGAVRTLWAEFKSLPDTVLKLTKLSKDRDAMAEEITTAIIRATTTMPPFGTGFENIAVPEKVSLESCIAADHVAILAKAEASQERGVTMKRSADVTKLREALHTSLEAWLGELNQQ